MTAQLDCSKATAHDVAVRFKVEDQVAKVFCGAFVGPGSRAMVVAFTPGVCGINGWAVFSLTGGTWQLVGSPHVGWTIALVPVGSDIRETAPIPNGRLRCPTTGRGRTRIWHWEGARLVAGPWKQASAPTTLHLQEFRSPSHNLWCDLVDDDVAYCASLNLPHTVGLNRDGVVTICNGSRCLGPPPHGSPALPVLGYGKTDVAGYYRCTSTQAGITCTVNVRGKAYGKGFLISRSGIRRVGP